MSSLPTTSTPVRSRSRSLLAGIALAALATAGLVGSGAAPSLIPAFAQTQVVPPATPPAALPPPAQVDQRNPLRALSFADVIERVKPAVVSVKLRREQVVDRYEDDDFAAPVPPGLRRYFGDRFGPNQGVDPRFMPPGPGGNRFGQGGPQRRGMVSGQGSGFFISADGYIVTNYHVVNGYRDIEIVMDNGKAYPAKVVGTDQRTDIALLKVDAQTPFPYVSFAAQRPRIGDWVLAVGNPFGLGGTVTAGIVSANGRDIGSSPDDAYLQIDAPVNKGNSGGPTFDVDGNVVGVNTAIYSPSGGSVGIAFAIPAETVARVVAALKDGGSVERGFIGVETRVLSEEVAANLGLKDGMGALVATAMRDAPAGKAGLRAGDVIRSVNGDPVRDPRDLARKIGLVKPGTAVEMVVWREGREQKFSVEVARRPADSFETEQPVQPRRRG